MNPDEHDPFVRAGAALAAESGTQRERNATHADVVRGMIAAERRRRHRRAHHLRIAGRASAAFTIFALAAWVGVAGVARGSIRARDVTFRFDDARALSVAVVGEFNEWNPRSTPMTRDANGTWQARVTIRPGRHTYAFVVNDSAWVADPVAARAPEKWFGDPRSVLVIASAR